MVVLNVVRGFRGLVRFRFEGRPRGVFLGSTPSKYSLLCTFFCRAQSFSLKQNS